MTLPDATEPADTSAPRPAPALPDTVRRLGWLHAANDFSLDFITPLLPAGVPTAWLGVMEGCADGVAQAIKLVSGRASDASGQRARWVRTGYGTNAVARPLVAIGMLLAWPAWIIACRIGDRVGKGLRGSASDALVADWVDGHRRAHAFAQMRTLDHLGSAAGSLCAAGVAWWLVLDYTHPQRLALVVMSLILPMTLMIWLCRGLRDHPEATPRTLPPGFWPRSPVVQMPVIIIAIASLGAKLAPLLVLVHVAGISFTTADAPNHHVWPVWLVCLSWGALAIVQAGAATLAGTLTELMGPRLFLQLGWSVTALLFGALACAQGPWLIATGVGWGAIAGLTEGAEKTWLADLAPKEERALAFGALGVVSSAAMLVGGSAVGFGLQIVGPLCFWLPAGGLMLAIVLMAFSRRSPDTAKTPSA